MVLSFCWMVLILRRWPDQVGLGGVVAVVLGVSASIFIDWLSVSLIRILEFFIIDGILDDVVW